MRSVRKAKRQIDPGDDCSWGLPIGRKRPICALNPDIARLKGLAPRGAGTEGSWNAQ